MALPIKDGKITTAYNRKCCRVEGAKKTPHYWTECRHKGVDFKAAVNTPVYAVADGKMTNASWGKSYGSQIVQILPDGSFWIYAHLSKLTKSAGNSIAKGELIGYSGNTGNSSAPHLHCERRDNIRWSAGKDLDPAEILGA